jgi:hypothetical protein
VDAGYNIEFTKLGPQTTRTLSTGTITITNGDATFKTLHLESATITFQVPVVIDQYAVNFTIDASKAKITKSGEGKLTLKANISLIKGSGVAEGAIDEGEGSFIEVTTTIPESIGPGESVAVVNITAEQLAAITGGGTVYVTGKLTLGAITDLTTLGTTVDLSAATITIPSTGATLTLPATTEIKAIDAGTGKVTIAGAATGLTIGSLNGTVGLPNTTLAEVTINSGTGKIEAASGGTTITSATIGGDLTLASGTLTVGGTDKTLNIPAGGSLALVTTPGGTAAELIVTSGTTGVLKGEITVGDGAVLKDLTSGGGSLWKDDESTGSYVIEAGAKAYSGSDTTNPIIGTDKTTSTIVLDTKATLKMTKGGYVLDGDATIYKSFLVTGSLHITQNTVLTLAHGSIQSGLYINGTLKLDGKIVNSGGGSRVALLTVDDVGSSINIGTTGTNNFYQENGTTLEGTKANGITSITLTEANKSSNGDANGNAYYEWDASINTNAGGWKLKKYS